MLLQFGVSLATSSSYLIKILLGTVFLNHFTRGVVVWWTAEAWNRDVTETNQDIQACFYYTIVLSWPEFNHVHNFPSCIKCNLTNEKKELETTPSTDEEQEKQGKTHAHQHDVTLKHAQLHTIKQTRVLLQGSAVYVFSGLFWAQPIFPPNTERFTQVSVNLDVWTI